MDCRVHLFDHVKLPPRYVRMPFPVGKPPRSGSIPIVQADPDDDDRSGLA